MPSRLLETLFGACVRSSNILDLLALYLKINNLELYCLDCFLLVTLRNLFLIRYIFCNKQCIHIIQTLKVTKNVSLEHQFFSHPVPQLQCQQVLIAS